MKLGKIVRTLRAERKVLLKKVDQISGALAALVGREPKKGKRGHKMSKAARLKISKAQKARWANKEK